MLPAKPHHCRERESNPLYKLKLNKLIAVMLFICLAHFSPLISNAQFCNQSGIGLGNVISASTTISNQYIYGNSLNLTIGNGSAPIILTLNKVEFNVLETKKIVVTKNATLNITQTHIFSCNWPMWDGIEVQPGGSVIINGNSLIEDAICGVNYLKNGAITPYFYPSNYFALKTDEVIFNRCKIGIQINEYNYTHPTIASSSSQILPGFEVTRTVFTSRDLTYSTLFNWVTYAALTASAGGTNNNYPFSSDYINDNIYRRDILRDPTMGTFPKIGIFLNKVGNTIINNLSTVPKWITSATFYDFSIGVANSSSSVKDMKNVFDYVETGVMCIESNLKICNSVFQNLVYNSANSRKVSGSTYNPSATGIWSDGGDVTNRRLLAYPPTGNTNDACMFIDCYRGIQTIQLLTNDIKLNSFRSSQSLVPTTALYNYLNTAHVGKFGIYIESDRIYKNFINQNQFSNIENGIYFNHRPFPGSLLVGSWSISYPSKYSEQMNIQSNTFKGLSGTFSFQYINIPIYVEGILPGFENKPNTNITIKNNLISNSYNGIFVNGFKGTTSTNSKDVICRDNTISLVPNYKAGVVQVGPNTIALGCFPPSPICPTGTYASQYGILYSNNLPSAQNYVFNNTVTFTGSNNPLLTEYGVYSISSVKTKVQCNHISNTDIGFEYSGLSTGCHFRRNDLTNNKIYGLELSNAANYGAQGSPTNASDNQWVGTTWVAPPAIPNSTYIFGAATTTSQPFYVQLGVAPFDPKVSSAGITSLNTYQVAGALLNGSANTIGCSSPSPVASPIPSPLPLYIDVDVAYRIINGSDAANSNFPIEADYNLRQGLYETLRTLPDSLKDSLVNYPPIDNFYLQGQSSNFEVMAQIDSLIGDTTIGLPAAYAAVNGFNPINQIEQNFKDYYLYYLGYITCGALSSADSMALYQLASSCPDIQGTAVFRALALYHSLNPDDMITMNNCDRNIETEDRGERKRNQKNTVSKENEIELFPNPSDGKFSISSLVIGDTYAIELINSLGQKVHSSSFISSDTVADISLQLNGGIYLVIIKNNTKNETIIRRMAVE